MGIANDLDDDEARDAAMIAEGHAKAEAEIAADDAEQADEVTPEGILRAVAERIAQAVGAYPATVSVEEVGAFESQIFFGADVTGTKGISITVNLTNP